MAGWAVPKPAVLPQTAGSPKQERGAGKVHSKFSGLEELLPVFQSREAPAALVGEVLGVAGTAGCWSPAGTVW